MAAKEINFMAFVYQLGLMFLGVLFVIWLRAAWSVRSAADVWDWHYFINSNAARFVLSFAGVLILGTAAFFDAAGVQSTIEKFGTGIQLGAGFGSGAVIAAFLLIVPATGKNALVALLMSSLVLAMTGCPKANIETVKSNSKKVATYANAGVEITRALFQAKKISLERKDAVADGFISLAEGGAAFDALVASIEAQYVDKAIPKSEIKRLFDTFNKDVVAKLVGVLKELKVPGTSNFDELWPKIELLKTAILAVAGAFGQREAVASQISGA